MNDGTVLGLSPYLAILLGAALPTHVWRWLGVLLAGRLDEKSELIAWVKAVATALLAALIAKLILDPTGPLAAVPVFARVGAAALGFAAYLVSGNRLFFGVITGEAVLLAAWFAFVD
jgi:branched-subunit amino acid transport protein